MKSPVQLLVASAYNIILPFMSSFSPLDAPSPSPSRDRAAPPRRLTTEQARIGTCDANGLLERRRKGEDEE